ncbi:MAG: Hsp20/alpha crystallin family protein [Actinomycetota bacterium]|nr:Hsp20/alpha crystallin family protein [Actinomycetota bacterium]
MRLGTSPILTRDFDDIVSRFFNEPQSQWTWPAGGYNVPTDVFHVDDALVIRMELPGVDASDVEVAVQENTLLINGTRKFPFDADKVRFVRRGSFYGEFTQKVALGKGLNVEAINARYDNGVLELRIPYAEEVQPKKISIEVGSGAQELNA